jgi:hypothetical protein
LEELKNDTIMGQYSVYTTGVLTTYTDGVDTFRDGERGGNYVIDKALTPTGFAGAENTDWINRETQHADNGGLDVFRDGVRNGGYVIDETLTATGFSGVETTDEGLTGDWINMETIDI